MGFVGYSPIRVQALSQADETLVIRSGNGHNDSHTGLVMFLEREIRIDITNHDIRLAKAAWLTAWESDAPNDRVADLYVDYAALISAQAQQIADDVRSARPRLVE